MMKSIRILAALLAVLICATAVPALGEGPSPSYKMPYYIDVDISSQIVTVYDTPTGEIVRQMLCSTGSNDHTPTGLFKLPKGRPDDDRKPWYYIRMFNRFVKYATRIRGQILFHSMPYTRKSLQAVEAEAVEKLGYPVSHGCIRLRWQDAEFIALNCLEGTAVRIYKSGNRNDELRVLLLQQSYDSSKGMTYDEFLGITHEEGALGWASESREVLDLQYRLRDLGLYDGELNGVYGSGTVNAVRTAQVLMGEAMSGVATADFQQAVYAADAPTAMNVTLTEGMSGPAVRRLQDNLAALRLFGDVPDSVYDTAVVEAVKRFQRAYGYPLDGVAEPTLQKAVAYEAGRLAETFGDDEYTFEDVGQPLQVARVTVEKGARLREKASQDSRQLKRIEVDSLMLVLEKGGEWSKVKTATDVGYVKNELVKFIDGEVSVLTYSSADGERVYTVGNTADDYRAGASLPCDVFAEYLAANDQQVDVSQIATFVTVDTHGEAEALNLRQRADSESAVLATVPDGQSLRAKQRSADWTLVTYNGQDGYLLNRYLNFWTDSEDALEAETDSEEAALEPVTSAIVKCAAEGHAAVYAEDADDAEVLGHLPDGVTVDILDLDDGWCHISYEGHEGYMIAEDLIEAED